MGVPPKANVTIGADFEPPWLETSPTGSPSRLRRVYDARGTTFEPRTT